MTTTMNCASRIVRQVAARRDGVALWTSGRGAVSFAELGEMAGRVQRIVGAERIRPGDAVMLAISPGMELFAAIVGLLASGVAVVFVEPWLPVAEVEHVLRLVRPAALIGGVRGRLWAARARAARAIPIWIPSARIRDTLGSSPPSLVGVDPQSPAVITFTSGTTDRPKGIVRTHRYMSDLHEILAAGADGLDLAGPDLCVLPNLALHNMACGRGSILVPHDWSSRSLRTIADLPLSLQPESMVCGPGFLERLLAFAEHRDVLPALRVAAIGGASADCGSIERGIARWSGANWMHVYGGTEVEPVTRTDARESVRRSRARGWSQLLHVGHPIPELSTRISADGLWVSGPNVADAFRPLGESRCEPNAADASSDGRHWHRMGDRIVADAEGWWFAGRSSQPEGLFDLEQRIYAALGTSACFVHRAPDGRLVLHGERLRSTSRERGISIERRFPEIDDVVDLRIVRDRRHRSRIDRVRSLAGAGVAS
jgi:acyl-CoA synthetase (AMP-forming)/AMP-acid ligase II